MTPLRITVFTRSYPSADDLYQYPFVHRRVLAYAAAGHEVQVVRPSTEPGLTEHRFDGVRCLTGDGPALAGAIAKFAPDVIAAHGISEVQWPILAASAGTVAVCNWLHGSEIPAIARGKAALDLSGDALLAAQRVIEARCSFWNDLLAAERVRLCTVSMAAREMTRPDWGHRADKLAVVPNPIDTDLFAFEEKGPDDRFNILMIRPFDSRGYGNDMAVDAIRRLTDRPGFSRLTFTIVGDGPLFEETLSPIRDLPNVRAHRGFLTQSEIAALHRRHGIFLVPTRLDTQGVSRDEAMSSGLVPVTNAIPAVLEFADDACAALAETDSAASIAARLWSLIDDPALFCGKSRAAGARVRAQSSADLVIPRELSLLEDACRG